MKDSQNKLMSAEAPLGYDALLATVGKHTYRLSDDQIENGDTIYNIHAKTIDKCLMIDKDDMMCVEFPSGGRAVFSTKNYRKATKL
jgi:hypothetical protein